MSQALIVSMAAHVALAALLYVLLTVARAPTVWGIVFTINFLAVLGLWVVVVLAAVSGPVA